MRNRKIDLGDISPANTIHFVDALKSDVQGVQVLLLIIRLILNLKFVIFCFYLRLILMMVIVLHGEIQ